jgi:hypothetical protein
MAGIGFGDALDECFRKALEIGVDDVKAFLEGFSNKEARYLFCVDAMIACAADGALPDGQTAFLAETAEMLGIGQNELRYLASIAKSILEQSIAVYDEAKKSAPESVRPDLFFGYVKEYYTGLLVDTDARLHFYSHDNETVDFTAMPGYDKEKHTIEFREQEICFENVSLDVATRLRFDHNARVEFISCAFRGKPPYNTYMGFYAAARVDMRDCRFNKIEGTVASFSAVDSLYVQDCCFTECGLRRSSSSKIYGGIFRIDKASKKIHLKNSEFNACYIINTKDQIAGLIIGNSGNNWSDTKLTVHDCRFMQCYHSRDWFGIYMFENFDEKKADFQNNTVTGESVKTGLIGRR